MMDQERINVFMRILQKKLDALVYADVVITEEIYEHSSAIKITIRSKENPMRRFDHRISRYEVEYSCDSFGMERYANLVSEKILYENVLVRSWIVSLETELGLRSI